MSEIRTVEDIRRRSGWREALEERQNYEHEKRKRELAEERERQQARKAREVEAASTNWYAAVDSRVHEHLKNWLWNAIDDRIREHLKSFTNMYNDVAGSVIGKFGARARKELETAIDKLREEFRVGIGRLPIAKTWDPDEVCYRGDVVVCDGAVFQALKDTGKTPMADHPDWILLARAGRDGRTPNFRGGFHAHKKYRRLDAVEFDGSSFVALRDEPGILGGDGWQLLSRAGSRGATGDAGPRGRTGVKGERGDAAPEIIGWHLEPTTYRVFPLLPGGKMGPELDLRGLFVQFCAEAVAPAADAAVVAALKDMARG